MLGDAREVVRVGKEGAERVSARRGLVRGNFKSATESKDWSANLRQSENGDCSS